MLSKPANELERMINPMADGTKQYAFYVAKKLNISYEDALSRVSKVIDKRKSSPMVTNLYRDVDDRVLETMPLDDYLKEAEGRVLMPNGCIYRSEKEKQSMLGLYMDTNLRKRKAAKSEMFKALSDNRLADADRLNNSQIAFKGKVNTPTGILRSKATGLYSPSTNTALTSNSRLITSTNNTNYERFLKGRRHYYNYDITIANMNSIANGLYQYNTADDWHEMVRIGIHQITPNELFSMILRSTRLYWNDDALEYKILEYCNDLNVIERMAVAYSGDLYTFRVYNSKLMTEFLDEFIVKKKASRVYTKDDMYSNVDEDMRNYLQHRYSNSVIGLGNEYDKYDPELLSDMVETGISSTNVIMKYRNILRTIITHTNLPPVVFDIYHMVRDQILMSDTDSGAGTLQDWVEWHQGSLNVNETALSVSNALVYLASATTQVYIKQVCKNINMTAKKLDNNIMHMKSEFTWIVFGLMSITKHYFAGVNIREGSVFERKLEVKGGSLKSNATSKYIKDHVYNKIAISIIDDVEKNGKVSLNKYIDSVIELEALVIESVLSGGSEYLKTLNILDATSYGNEDPQYNSYKHIILWNDVFSVITNGHTVVTPCDTVKYPTTLSSKKKIRNWIEDMDNQRLKDAVTKWNNRFNLTAINRLYIPKEYVVSYGLPSELKSIIAVNDIVTDVCKMAYTALEILGYYKATGYSLMEIVDGERYRAYGI